jgi:hypothetical protein
MHKFNETQMRWASGEGRLVNCVKAPTQADYMSEPQPINVDTVIVCAA